MPSSQARKTTPQTTKKTQTTNAEAVKPKMLSVPPPNKVVPDASNRNRALFDMMHRGVVSTSATTKPADKTDYSSVQAMDYDQKVQFLKRPDYNPFQLKDPYDFLNAQMYRWQNIAKNVQAGKYTEDEKKKIADQAYERMIMPYYKATGQTPVSKSMWMQEAYKSGANFNLDDRYKNPYSRGVMHGAYTLGSDFLRAVDTFHNIVGAIVSPPKPITDETWHHSLLKTKDNTSPTGFWDQVREMASDSVVDKFKNKYLPSLSSKALNHNADKLQFLQDLRPNKGFVDRASSMAVEAAPFIATNLLAPEVGGPEDIGLISRFVGKKLAGRITLGALEAGRDGAIYGALTRPYKDKGMAFEDAISWSVGSAVLHLGGSSLVAVGKKVFSSGEKGFSEALSHLSKKGKMIDAGQEEMRPEEVAEVSEAGVAENIAKYGMAGQRAIDNSAAEHILKMESSGMNPEQIMDHERNMLMNGSDADRVMLDSVTRIRSTLGEGKLGELPFEKKADLLARLQGIAANASGKMTKHVETLQAALKQRFTSLSPEKLDQNIQKHILQEVLPSLPKDASPQMIQKAVQDKWGEMVVQAGTWAEEELMKDPFGEAKNAEVARKKATKQLSSPGPVGTVSRTKRWTNTKGEPGVSFSISPAWKVYAKNAVEKSGKQWDSQGIKEWLQDLSDDDFAADLHAYFMPSFLKNAGLYFEHGSVTGGVDHTNLYAFMYNYKNQMPKEYAARLEEEYMHSPKMAHFFDQVPKQQQPQLMRHISLAMWNHIDNLLGSGRFPKERNAFRSTQSDLRNPTEWQKDLFSEREDQERKIISKMYDSTKPAGKAALNTLKVLFAERREAFKADEQAKMRMLSRGITDRIIEDSKGKYEDWGLK